MSDEQQYIHLTVDDVVLLHDQALQEFGGAPGIRSYHALASAVGQVEQDVFGQELYPTLPEKAAAYAYFIAQGHPFVDGNKRTAALALETFLDLNGYELDQTDEQFEAMILSVAAGQTGREELTHWVSQYARLRDLGDIIVVDFKK